ncbi:MAG: F0F1 ATP synthase subunit epsilon [Candidatus Liptonbacteria bacterium]|nr:F0F1 ATP synthase subunit epsilon [Candidatus Liptonbacteria bacterium]
MRVIIAKVDETYFDGEADSLTAPGTEGEMTILPKHMPVITTLKEGKITVRSNGETKEFSIDEGILEVHGEGVTVVL